jgi:hypothetical protein
MLGLDIDGNNIKMKVNDKIWTGINGSGYVPIPGLFET